MIAYTNEEWIKLEQALQQISIKSENILQQAEQSYHAVQSALQRIKEFIGDYQFKDTGEEIRFFKEIKPLFLSELIYHMKIFYVEADKPVGNAEMQTSYYKHKMDSIKVFFERHHILYIYYRMGKSDQDNKYFVRTAETQELLPEYCLDNDPQFSNVYSYKLAKIQAYERLNEFLQHSIYSLEHPQIAALSGDKNQKNTWTDTKASLIELAYAIHSRGSVNNGRGDVKQLITDLELLFNVQVGNFYRAFQSMRCRKKNRTPFLDTLKDSLERRMDETDLNYL